MAHETYEQVNELACGAACLLVAAKELGIEKMTLENSTQSYGLNMYCETILYNLRSNKSIGYTMPADLGIVARDVFGLNATVYMHGMALPWLLQKLYPEARANCNTAQIRVVTGKRHLSPEEREIRAVVVGPGAGLHWILCRPDRIYMDPATGKNYDSFKSMGQLKFLKYVSTGVSVIVAKPVLRNSLRNSITLP